MTRALLAQALDALSPLSGTGDRELCDAIRAAIAQPPALLAAVRLRRRCAAKRRAPQISHGVFLARVRTLTCLALLPRLKQKSAT